MLKTLPLCLELLIMDYKKQLDDFDKQVVKKTKKCKKILKYDIKNCVVIKFNSNKRGKYYNKCYTSYNNMDNRFCNQCGNYIKRYVKVYKYNNKIICNCKQFNKQHNKKRYYKKRYYKKRY